MKTYLATDGKMVLKLCEAKEGGYIVTAPFEPGVNTRSEDIVDAFENARNAAKEWKATQAKYFRELGAATRRKRRR